MNEFTVKRVFQSSVTTGFVATVISFVLACIIWPIWSIVMKSVFSALAATGIAAAPELGATLITIMVEGSWFWLLIHPWIWLILVLGACGKTTFSSQQPYTGLSYTVMALITGALAFFVVFGFIGIWWKPFNLVLMLMPKTAEDVALAILGWEAATYFIFPFIMVQISFVALFHKWPFAGTSKPAIENWGVMFFSTLVAVIFWIAAIVPSFMPLAIGGEQVVFPPMGSWATFAAFCQAFIFVFLIPAEGGEGYPMKFFAKKQPLMGVIGFLIALAAGFILPPIIRGIVAPMNLLPGAPVDLVVASLLLSCITCLLAWHSLFDDFPSVQDVPNKSARVLIRLAIWLILGFGLGTIWIKTFTKIPFGANDLGLGLPTMGVLGGQLAFLTVVLYLSAFFDKWPLIYKEPLSTSKKEITSRFN
ncbi:MAG: hypothetical protein GX334_08810 [Firmicutes bacterium]|nr:hypothetical protein [Bacillota bacterium]